MRRIAALAVALLPMLALSAGGTIASGATHPTYVGDSLCQQRSYLCLDPYHSIGENGAYTGHDEPTVQFISKRPGTGGHLVYYVTLPRTPR